MTRARLNLLPPAASGAAALALLLGAALLACRGPSETSGGASPDEAAVSADLPPLHLTDDTPNLLITWVGDDGDFHVVERISEVPQDRREHVRVVVTDRAEGQGSSVYVADLRSKQPDGSYPVSARPRADWDKLGAEKRKVRMEALAPGSRPEQPPGSEAANEGAEPNVISAIIYGADWCKPCHDAEAYLKSLGVAVTKKDIEESRAAQAEMQEKLHRVNRGGASIPVIDVMGKIFVGYSPGSLKQAVEAARRESKLRRG